MSQEALDLFISYAHNDAALREKLDEHLAPLQREGEIRVWHDRKIAAGDDWQGQIDDRLEAADLILLLISASFLASDYCYDVEATRALERHTLGEARVIPIIIRPCDWKISQFAELPPLPANGKAVTTWRNREQAWLDIAQGIRASIANPLREHSSGTAKSQSGLRRPGDRQPQYADDQAKRLSHRLKTLFKRRKELTLTGDDTSAVEGEILDVRRLLRKGPQLSGGEFLGDGRYELIEILGQGGFATVWKAWDGEAQRLVAVKVLHGHYSQDRGKRERFFRGARKMADLAHTHIVRVLETECAEDGWHFFVMEYLGGGNFEQAVLNGSLSSERRLELLLQAGQALEHAHQQGAVHRDVKPSNILLDDKQAAKLSDFDLVRATDTTGLTATRAMMGTVQFAAPETLGSAGEATPRTDVYSLASTAVFALGGGRLPAWYYRDPARAIAELDCATETRHVLEQATAFDIKKRFASVAEFCEALDRASQLPASEVASDQDEIRPHKPRRATALILSTVLLLLALWAIGLMRGIVAPKVVSTADKPPAAISPSPPPPSESTAPGNTSTFLSEHELYEVFKEALHSRSMSDETYQSLRSQYGGDLQPRIHGSDRAMAAASSRLSGREWPWSVPIADIKAHRDGWPPAWGPESFSPVYGSSWAAAMSGLMTSEDWWATAKPWLIAHALASGPVPHIIKVAHTGQVMQKSRFSYPTTSQPIFSIHPGDRFLWTPYEVSLEAELSVAHPVVSLAAGLDIEIHSCVHPFLGTVLSAILDCKAQRPKGWGPPIKLGKEATAHLSKLPPLPEGLWYRYRWYADASRAVAVSKSRVHVRGPVVLAIFEASSDDTTSSSVTYYTASVEEESGARWTPSTCRLQGATWVVESTHGGQIEVAEPAKVELGVLWDHRGARIEIGSVGD